MGACSEKTDPAPPGSSGLAKSAAPVASALPGIDTSKLSPREQKDFSAQVSELLAPCADTPVSIAQCVTEKRACKACEPAAKFLLTQVQRGLPKKECAELYELRFSPKRVKAIALEGAISRGPDAAPVTIVEWADFQCPACRNIAPLLEYLEKRFDGQVRMVYKFFPLSSHKDGETAARAGWAAHLQGKFWEMHHEMFEHQDKLEQPDLEVYAKKLGLDLGPFRGAMTAKETLERIEKDKKQAEELGLQGTPFLFINGRELHLEKFPPQSVVADLEEWVRLEIELAGQVPKPKPADLRSPFEDEPAPAGSGSSAPPSASTAPAGSTAPAASASPSATARPKGQ